MTHYQIAPRALWRNSIGGVVVVGDSTSEAKQIAAPGDTVWRLLTNPQSIDEIVDQLAGSFDTATATIRSDIETLIDDLRELGLVVRVD